MRKTAARFKVERCHVDGRDGGTLLIEPPMGEARTVLVTFRPHHGRAYTLALQEVAEMIAWRVAKKEASR